MFILFIYYKIFLIKGFYGFGPFFGLQLDLLTVPASIVLLLLTLHVGNQFTGEFISCWAKDERLKRSFEFTITSLWKVIFKNLIGG